MTIDNVKELILRHGENECCLIWQFETNGKYGVIHTEGKRLYVHRLALELKLDASIDGFHALHKCDTPLCFNQLLLSDV